MKTVTPQALAEAYCRLYPAEAYGPERRPELACILANWLRRYEESPDKALSPSGVNWYGKCTRALFLALGLKFPMPPRKADMTQALKLNTGDSNMKSTTEIAEDLEDGRYTLTDVVDAVIQANGIIGVGLITLADGVAAYIRHHPGARARAIQAPKRQGEVRLAFWDRHPQTGGLMKLRLSPGKPARHHGGGRTDEGYHSWSSAYEWDLDDGVLRYTYITKERDCDGEHRDGGTYIAPVTLINGRYETPTRPDNETGLPMVNWKSDDQWTRDLAAEAAGY